MKLLSMIEALRRNMKILRIVLIAYLLVLAAYDAALVLFSHSGHARFWTDKFPVYWTLFSIVGCFLLIKIGKGIAHLFLSKNEDYYG
ncbi:MAG TPA: hypothetical protein VHO84_13765 [Syntrophorhabdaceae bacterium]|nr:hypothetical protein [Syntrophorhabdaceae bacterium]